MIQISLTIVKQCSKVRTIPLRVVFLNLTDLEHNLDLGSCKGIIDEYFKERIVQQTKTTVYTWPDPTTFLCLEAPQLLSVLCYSNPNILHL